MPDFSINSTSSHLPKVPSEAESDRLLDSLKPLTIGEFTVRIRDIEVRLDRFKGDESEKSKVMISATQLFAPHFKGAEMTEAQRRYIQFIPKDLMNLCYTPDSLEMEKWNFRRLKIAEP
ncbi:MAG: hypothetical protein K9M07_01255 [Simkaniaceae bacterium]|nr:hypothetical protein [Simkaniaceae bacterium]